MTVKLALVSSLLFTALLKADVDLSRVSKDWIAAEVPEALATQLKAGGGENKGYFTTADASSLLIYNSKKSTGPDTAVFREAALEAVKSGFGKSAATSNTPLKKNEIVERDGMQLLHQEFTRDGVMHLVINQMTATAIEQVMMTAPPENFEALAPGAFALFRPASPPADPDPVTAAAPVSDAERFGYLTGMVLIAVILGGLVLTALGIMRFSRRNRG